MKYIKFQLLASLCSLSQNSVFQNQINLDNNEFVTIYLLSELQVQSEVNATVQFFKNSASTRINSFVNYLRTITQANYLVSALNTNLVVEISGIETVYLAMGIEIIYYEDNGGGYVLEYMQSCGNGNPTSRAIFDESSNNSKRFYYISWSDPMSNSTFVNGFFAGCTPFEALLRSKLDCLYDIKCLQLLINYFPALKQVCITLFYLS
ncbi:unnamed protein product [Rotaria sp. Silwood2]|nr:unnamed protein product [Rotaria sp. Silwood2]